MEGDALNTFARGNSRHALRPRLACFPAHTLGFSGGCASALAFAKDHKSVTRETFHQNLSEAARGIIGATRKYVEERLPDEARFLVLPNCSFDGNPLEDDEEVFPQETLPEWTTLPPKTCDQAVDHLFRAGKVPEWINVYVDLADDEFSYLLLECCGRFTAMEKHLYYVAGGIPPFNPQIPLPSLEYDLQKHGKFHLRSRYNKSEQGGPANAAPPHR